MAGTTSWGWRVVPVVAMIAGLGEPSMAGFTIRDLGLIAVPGTSGAEAINATGQAAGSASAANGVQVAVKTTGAGGFQAISLPSGASSSVANSINISGNVAGTYVDNHGVQHGFYTSTNQSVALNPLTSRGVSGTYTQANGINGSNQVVGTGDLPGGSTRAFVAGTGGTPSIINPLGTGGFNQGNGINDGGTVVGTSETSPGGIQHAFLAGPNGPATDLLARNPAGAFAYNTYGMAISNAGGVAGYGDVGRYEHAFYAPGAGGALVDLGVLPGASSSLAYGVNDLAHVVGELDYGSSLPGLPSSRAFVWDGSFGMIDLNTLMFPSAQANWVLTKATGINDPDQISGEGYLNNVLHGFILTPIPGEPIFLPAASVPAPPSLVLSALGFGFAATWAGFRRGRSGGRAAA